MTRTNYVAFAAMFSGELALRRGDWAKSNLVRSIILSTADIMAADNSRFDRGVFYIASGLTEDGELEAHNYTRV